MPEQTKIDITIVIPCLNEEHRLPIFLKDVIAYCQKSSFAYEIIVVDDGSTDQTPQAASVFQSTFSPLEIIHYKTNQGKGYAVREGFLKARGEIVLFIDADGSTPVTEIEAQLKHFQGGADIVIGSRKLLDQEHRIEARWHRKCIGFIFSTLVHFLLIEDIEDTQCGFKMFKRSSVAPIFSRLQIQGFGFDLEVLYLAKLLGYQVKEVPVNWHHVDGSKINLIFDSFQMFLDIFKVRRLHKRLSVETKTLE